MSSRLASIARGFVLFLAAFLIFSVNCPGASSWSGVLRDFAGNPIDKAEIHLQATDGSHNYSATTGATGQFTFTALSAGSYRLTTTALGKTWTTTEALEIKDGTSLPSILQLSVQGQELRIILLNEAGKGSVGGVAKETA